MLEIDNKLQTYRLEKPPELILEGPVNAEKIFDHSLKFLTYQGPVNQGQGQVRLVESGKYSIKHQTCEKIELVFEGQALSGLFVLIKVNDNIWQLFRSGTANE